MSARPTGKLAFEPDEFRAYVDDMGLTREEQDELLRAVWEIMCGFARFGCGFDPVQLIQRTDDGGLAADGQSSCKAKDGEE